MLTVDGCACSGGDAHGGCGGVCGGDGDGGGCADRGRAALFCPVAARPASLSSHVRRFHALVGSMYLSVPCTCRFHVCVKAQWPRRPVRSHVAARDAHLTQHLACLGSHTCSDDHSFIGPLSFVGAARVIGESPHRAGELAERRRGCASLSERCMCCSR